MAKGERPTTPKSVEQFASELYDNTKIGRSSMSNIRKKFSDAGFYNTKARNMNDVFNVIVADFVSSDLSNQRKTSLGKLSYDSYSSNKSSFLQRIPTLDKNTSTIRINSGVISPFPSLAHMSNTRVSDYGTYTLNGGITVDVSHDNSGNVYIKRSKKKKR